MTRSCLFALMVLAPAAFAHGPKFVDLDRPGAFEALAERNPAHHARAIELIRVAEQSPCKFVPGVYRAKDKSNDSGCAPTLLMTSFPPKCRVAFTLDDTTYETIVTVRSDARLMPAK